MTSFTSLAVVGAGIAGLACATKLQEAGLKVRLFEKSGGASGRNGGFAMTWASKLSTIVKICGAQEGLRLLRASQDAVRTIGTFCRDNGIDAHYRPDGWLWTAADQSQDDAWADIVAIHEKKTSGARVIKPPFETKPGVTLPLCDENGLRDQFIASRDKAAYRAARKREWGDWVKQ